MIPKEKAIELVGKMCINDCTIENIKYVKRYALIAVDEIISLSKIASLRRDNVYMELEYWQEVKQEIKKL